MKKGKKEPKVKKEKKKKESKKSVGNPQPVSSERKGTAQSSVPAASKVDKRVGSRIEKSEIESLDSLEALDRSVSQAE